MFEPRTFATGIRPLALEADVNHCSGAGLNPTNVLISPSDLKVAVE